MKLYELTGQLIELNAMADDPEMAEAVTDTLEGLNMELSDKAEKIMYVITNRDGDIEALDKEIARLTARKKQLNNFQSSLKNYLQYNMEASGMKKIECPLFTITLAAGRDVAIIDDADALPDDYVKVETTVKPVKADILKALKAGETVPGAHIEKSQSSIRIK